MRVHFLASTLALGGAETMAVALSRELAGRGHEVAWSLLRNPGELGERMSESLAAAHGLAPGKFPLAGIRRLRSRLRGCDALYVLDHQNAVVLGGLAARWETVPRRAVAVHTTGLWGDRPSLGRAFRGALRFYDRVLALSDAHARYLTRREGVPAEKVAVVPNGIDPAPYRDLPSREGARARLHLPSDALVVGTVAMLRPEKNHAMLARAVAALAGDFENLHAVWVGDGPERAALAALVESLGIRDRVHFEGRRDDVPALLSTFDVFALPSHASVETQPVSVIEAMTAGVPVAATRVGDLESLLGDGSCGVLCPPGDLGGFTEALRGLLADAGLRARLARAGRRRAAEFTLEAAGNALERALSGEDR